MEDDDDDLVALKFSSDWTAKIDGELFNDNGHTVRFDPDSGEPVPMTTTPVGQYKAVQFHFHWGSKKGEGSEHRVDGVQSELEIHFVHNRISGGNPGNQNAVVAVFGRKKDIPVTGIWSQLAISSVQPFDASAAVSDVVYNDLLPSNRDYYFYEGSLTTPACTESVQWFVLKNPIDVPAAFLDDLREVEKDEDGNFLTFNFRDVQDLNDRTVFCFEGMFKLCHPQE